MYALDWRGLTGGGNDPAYMRTGTELACAFVPDTHSRFMVYEVRTFVIDPAAFLPENRSVPSVTYYVRDAETVSDAGVRAGKKPAIVFRNDDLTECLRWCLTQISKPVHSY